MSKSLASVPKLREQVAGILAQEIQKGRFESHRLPSVRALSERFGVSTLTIIGALDELESRNLIERVHGKGVFLRDRHGHSRKLGQRSLDICVFSLTAPRQMAADSYYGEVWAGLMDATARQRARLSVSVLSTDDVAAEVRLALSDKKFDGGILLALTNREALLQIQRLDLPFVLTDHHYQGLRMDCVVLDSREGSRTAVQHLASCGYRSIGLLAARRIEDNPERMGGFLQGLTEVGFDTQNAFIRHANSDFVGGHETMTAILNSSDPVPEAFYVWNGPMASGALHALQASTNPAAKQIKLVAAASPTLRQFHPGLASVVADGRALGTKAIELLIQRIEKPETPFTIALIPMEFHLGAAQISR